MCPDGEDGVKNDKEIITCDFFWCSENLKLSSRKVKTRSG